jgi:hypothetical protein
MPIILMAVPTIGAKYPKSPLYNLNVDLETMFLVIENRKEKREDSIVGQLVECFWCDGQASDLNAPAVMMIYHTC